MENQQSASPSEQPAVVEPTTTTTTEKTEKGFHLRKFLSFDDTLHSIKQKLGLKDKKSNDTEKSAADETEKATASPAATIPSSEKKESGFHLNFISSLDDTLQNIKGKLGMEEKKPSDSEKSGTTDEKAVASEPEKTTVGQPETAASSEKKESGFHLNFISSLDDTLQNIKGKLGMEEKKTSDTEKSGTTDEKAAAGESETATSSEKKESEFHLPSLPSFDNTFQNIKGKLGLEKTKSHETDKTEQLDAVCEKEADSATKVKPSTTNHEKEVSSEVIPSSDHVNESLKL
ncbi:unnamed protein product [Rotaria socialis]|uniref:Uncharacterized protein n=1 Tax=Rotaria socialis TaxID=392032 RepID=A0A821AEF1_9BILA|nr:unnamed protein product [Rotaria socialis]CAF3780216.1 unnamed protein product [Rotaria socialis]CAF4575771.1 unnamed protein product [Rotaria socialis]CAF4601721.1 unnamed protein product [Rotaria socialis]